MCGAASSRSLDDLVGALLQKPLHLQPERLAGLEIYDEVKLGRLHHWKIARLGALEYSASVNSGLAIPVGDVGSVAHQATSQNKVAHEVNRRNFVARGKRDKLFAAAKEKRIKAYE